MAGRNQVGLKTLHGIGNDRYGWQSPALQSHFNYIVPLKAPIKVGESNWNDSTGVPGRIEFTHRHPPRLVPSRLGGGKSIVLARNFLQGTYT